MLRDFRVLLDDILEASRKIRTYTASLSRVAAILSTAENEGEAI